MADEKEQSKMSRRRFMRNSGYVAGGAIGGGILGSLLGTNLLDTNQETAQETNDYNRALMFFTRQKDFDILSAATERIFPEDENGPGAIALGVPYFIDHQLAGSYGNNEKEYMQGPFSPGTDYQGYQSPLKRNELFLVGIQALEDESMNNYNTTFTELEGEQQDELLQAFQNNGVGIKGATSATFFETMRSATLEGAYSDPLYGGNANMDGWRMKEFPGSQMSFIDELDSEDFIEMEPNALRSHISH
ncbi:gluconate 2-dehydrogenase subunit 3 family protein [Lentibacillus sp. CBA3610]|uniref:gluconate 2-dehydrogenase subunit 3 family protein n=1 Tax=Lentibacillus sp. CBA3610 TaxID=2518176 RepID=UPI001595A566|nr:gluconate 2-dehydrogenase subunit 3 family protein [Lentibacillus sp. CBA3610]